MMAARDVIGEAIRIAKSGGRPALVAYITAGSVAPLTHGVASLVTDQPR